MKAEGAAAAEEAQHVNILCLGPSPCHIHARMLLSLPVQAQGTKYEYFVPWFGRSLTSNNVISVGAVKVQGTAY